MPPENDKSSISGFSRSAPLGTDHTVAFQRISDQDVLVVGLVRPSTVFEVHLLLRASQENELKPASTDQSRRIGPIEKEGLLLLRQLAYHCAKKKTRYGYIMTEKALTACRFSRMASPTAARAAELEIEKWKDVEVEVARVPWGSWGKKHLTTDLALWWLCMMALSELETKDNKKSGSQETREAEELPHISDQGSQVGLEALMPVVLPPLQAGAMGDQQENEAQDNQTRHGRPKLRF